ncbi:M14 family metallocarboxypeptidase [Bacillus sp. B190/17]|uniref:M14 family metallocarboxypeptidase n=1 Tax=Bacillus lumedeiriae TaxID=3058829 RepID=A0ABW8ICJ9_9BACI
MFKRKTLVSSTVAVVTLSAMFGLHQTGVASSAKEQEKETATAVNVKAAPPAAGQMDPTTFTPYFGQSYKQSEQVKALYPNPGVTFDTPAFKEGKTNFTTQEEMMQFLKELDSQSELMKMETTVRSLEGREMPVLIFTTSESEHSADFKRKPTVWMEAQIHGNEPAAGESALATAQRLALGELGREVLKNINVVMVPRKNPDGSYYFQRQNAKKLDANRDHMKFEVKEIREITKVFNRFKPEVTIALHEEGVKPSAYSDVGEQGALAYNDITMAKQYNLNTPKSIFKKTDDWLINSAHSDLAKSGYRSGTYLVPERSKDGEYIVWEVGTEPRFETTFQGLQPAFSLFVESRGIGIGKENFERRVAAQVAAQTSLLQTTANRAKQIKATVEAAREEVVKKGETVKDNDKIVINSTTKELPGKNKVKVVDIAKGEVVEIPVKYHSLDKGVPTLERIRPNAYILPPAYHEIAEKLQIAGIKVSKLKEAEVINVDRYKVTEQKVDERYYEGHLLNHVKTEIKEKEYFFPKGSYVFQMNQPAANLIAEAFEPEAVDSYVTFNFIPANLGDELPIYRYMQDKKLNVETVTQ